MHLMAQPDVASMWLGDRLLADQGLLSRVLPSAPDATSGKRMWRSPLPGWDDAIKRYGAHLLDIFERPLPLVPNTRNQLAPRPLPLSPGAQRLWTDFHDHVERRLGPGGELDPVRGLANKLPEHAARIAGVLTLVHDIEAGEIAEEEIKAGFEFAEHYAVEALRLHGGSQVRSDIRLAQRLLDWLLHTWTEPNISLPDIYQRSLNAIGDKATAKRLVGILEDHGWLDPISKGAVVAGQHRRDAWLIVRG
jgi:hypothetical protein